MLCSMKLRHLTIHNTRRTAPSAISANMRAGMAAHPIRNMWLAENQVAIEQVAVAFNAMGWLQH